jgi:2-C-methyl-D-erythritol 4-phosphate cytidylyltransferase
MKNCIIILAAGIGNRFQNNSPKQFVLLGGLPILMHTLNAFYHSRISPDIKLVLHASSFDHWENLCSVYNFLVPHEIIEGGPERFHSVKNALDSISDYDFVGIHDGVRPFVTDKVIDDCYIKAHQLGNATPAVPATNTIRIYDKKSPSKAVDRSHIYVVQNPQVFRVPDIKAAYMQTYEPLFTDDATVAERYGMDINIVEGDQRNIKITHPTDIAIASGILEFNKINSSILSI